MKLSELLKLVARSSLGVVDAKLLGKIADKHLFSTVIPNADGDSEQQEAIDVLLQLYSDLRKGINAKLAADQAFGRIRMNVRASSFCPAEVVIAELESAAIETGFDYAEQQRVASLPWSKLRDSLPRDLAVLSENLRIEIEASLHEVDEGFADPGENCLDLASACVALASELRAFVLHDSEKWNHQD